MKNTNTDLVTRIVKDHRNEVVKLYERINRLRTHRVMLLFLLIGIIIGNITWPFIRGFL